MPAIRKDIVVGGITVPMAASALVPKLYRVKFGRDMICDLQSLETDYKQAKNENGQMSVASLEVFENVSYMLAKHADKTVPEDPDEWLDSIPGVFSVYEAMPQILELWSLNTRTTSIPAKK